MIETVSGNFMKVLPTPRHLYDGTDIIKPAEEWTHVYHSTHWEVDNIFADGGLDRLKDICECYPIEDMNNQETAFDSNPFIVHHIPYWLFNPLAQAVRDFVVINYFKRPKEESCINDERLSEWANIFLRSESNPVRYSALPHVDYPYDEGFISNLWLSEHEPGTTGTTLYEYKGTIDEGRYDFQIDPNHHLYKKWHSWYGSGTDHKPGWNNFTDKEAYEWGFRKIAFAPAKHGTMTIYNANTPHSPYIADSVDFRWSHCFGFKYSPLNLHYAPQL
tara:strand:- start:2011 stop:2835 length:825 start_codon:yes stop_codon:yes gene_type:complete